MTALTRPADYRRTYRKIGMFSWKLRVWWLLLSLATIGSEVIPRSPSLLPVPYYSYTALKAVLFVVLGLFTPLTFWRFDSLGFGVIFSVLAAGAVEGLQSVSQGHHTSWLEFVAKLVLLFLGFGVALNARYDGVLGWGPVQIGLFDLHGREKG